VNIIFSDTNTHYRGSENYRRSGEVDAMRLPKDGYFAHQVMWNGWVDVEKPGVHLMGHWNYAPDVTKNVYAVSSADKVELFLNGRSLGFGKQSHRFLFTFPDMKWESGTLSAVAYEATGAKVAEASHETAGVPHAIRLTPTTGPGGLRADRSDVALVDVEVVDAEGRRCPTALNEIDFELAGPGEWRGGIAQGPDNYILSKRLPVECGVNRVIVRSTTEPGAIRLTASAAGIEAATIELMSHAVEVSDGWSLAHSDADLKPYLDRGPTPPGDSVTPTRTPLTIARTIAGGNADRSALAYDDNETTTWDNGGGVPTAWIRCELERPAKVSEVTMKLADWRNRSYPLRILVDDKEVFHGDSERSLGYVTFTFPPTKGRTVRIELVGASTERDAFDQIVEVTGQKLQNAENPPPANDEVNGNDRRRRGGRGREPNRGALRIVELELYEPLSP
jgi:beta-galactosidase